MSGQFQYGSPRDLGKNLLRFFHNLSICLYNDLNQDQDKNLSRFPNLQDSVMYGKKNTIKSSQTIPFILVEILLNISIGNRVMIYRFTNLERILNKNQLKF